MSDVMFGLGTTPLIRDGHQARFWALLAAGADVAAFLRQHPCREFAVFRPESIATAVDPTITPLFVESLPADGLPAESE